MASVTLMILNDINSPAGGADPPSREPLAVALGRKQTRPATPTAYPPFTGFRIRPVTGRPRR